MLRQGTKWLNQRHGSDGSGWGSRARARVTAAGYNGSSVRARSGLSEAETEVQARARVHRATAGQRNWRLSLARHNSGSSSRW